MTPAQRAAANLDYITYLEGDDSGNRLKRVRVIEAAYAEREAAVAELVKQSKLAATRLMRAYLDVRDLNEAIGAVEGMK